MELVISPGRDDLASKSGATHSRTVSLTDKSLTIGRDRANDLAFPDDPWLSLHHMKFERESDGWFVTDLGSRNGTIINRDSLKTSHLLRHGDRIYAGHLVIEVRAPGPARLDPLTEPALFGLPDLPTKNVENDREHEAELAQANEIQRRLLPTAAPFIPGYEIAGCNLSSKWVGGDYYDFIFYKDGRIAILISDVSGNGLPAALFMASLAKRIRALIDRGPDPASALAILNRGMQSDNRLFATCFYSLLTPDTGLIRYASAGHNPGLVLRSDDRVEELAPTGIVLGVIPSADYDLREAVLQNGDTLVIFSDGVVEAQARSEEEFGEGRLIEFLRGHRRDSACVTATALKNHLLGWVSSPLPFDDFTFVIVRRIMDPG